MTPETSHYLSTFKNAIARIYNKNGIVVGAGFLVFEQHLLTCAHVVAQALNIPQTSPESPTESIELDFPLIAPGHKVCAKVVFWRPVQPSQKGEDIAALQLETTLPQNLQPVRLVTTTDLWGHPFRVFGFPSQHELGVWASGILRDRVANDWVQMEDIKVPGYQVELGFSGAPVWDEALAGVIGIAVAAERQHKDAKAAFLIPTSVLTQTWTILNRFIEESQQQTRVLSLRQKLEKEQLQAELEAREKDYNDVARKYRREMNPAEKNSLQAQLDEILEEIDRIEQRLNK